MKKCKGAIILLLLCGLFLLTSCGGSGLPSEATPGQSAEHEAGPEKTEETAVLTDPELSDPDRDWEPIDTKFGRLCYPDDLYEYLQTEQTETKDGVKVMFRAAIGDNQIDLFELTIGETGGESAGRITGPDDVVRDVYLRFIPLEDLSGLSEGEANRVYAMQEGLNYVLDHLK